jgi:hypothetical protein
VYFAIGQISVLPGWRTKKDYICEVSARFSYASPVDEFVRRVAKYGGDEEAFRTVLRHTNTNDAPGTKSSSGTDSPSGTSGSGGAGDASHWYTDQGHLTSLRRDYMKNTSLPRTIYSSSRFARRVWGESSIGLVSAFPFAEAQVFDLQNDYSSQVNLLLSLAATYLGQGYRADAKAIFNFVKEVQKTLATRNALPTVVPGLEPDTLTYRFDPEVLAMTDPTQTKPKAGYQLLPTSIPVMVLCVCDKKDVAHWAQLGIDVEARWIPRSKYGAVREAADWVWTFGHPRDAEPSSAATLLGAQKLDDAYERLDQLMNKPQAPRNKVGPNAFGELRRQMAVLEAIGLGRTTLLSLPGSGPFVSSLQPASLAAGATNAPFTILGEDLWLEGEPPPRLRLGGFPLQVDATPPTASQAGSPQRWTPRSESTISATLAVGDNIPLGPGAYALEVETVRGSFSLTNALTVKSNAPSKQGPTANKTPRPDIRITSIMPTDEGGYVDAPTTFYVRGTNFQAAAWHDPVIGITVGGLNVTNFEVFSDDVLHFTVPAWSDGTTNFDETLKKKAAVVVSSALSACEAADRVYFDRHLLPPPPKVDQDTNPPLFKLLKLMGVETNVESRAYATFRLDAGLPPAGTNTNAPLPAPNSTVIIQNGQNSNAANHGR